jgi:hypothetical protein
LPVWALGRARGVGLGWIAAEEIALGEEKQQSGLEVGHLGSLVAWGEGGLDLAEHGGPGNTRPN